MKIIEVDDGYIVGGRSYTMEPRLTMFLAKLDTSGKEIWKKSYNHNNYYYLFGDLILVNGSYLFMNKTIYGSYFIMINKLGNIIWDKYFDNTGVINSELYSISSTTDRGYIATGYSGNMNKIRDVEPYKKMFVLKLDKDCNNDYFVGIGNNDELLIMNYELSQNYPNPFNPTTMIKYNLHNKNFKSAAIYVYNIKGEIIKEFKKLKNNQGFVQFNASKFNSGLYYYSLVIDGERQNTKSMVLIK